MNRKRKTKRSGRADRPENIPILNPNAAGMDIGADEIYVAVPTATDTRSNALPRLPATWADCQSG